MSCKYCDKKTTVRHTQHYHETVLLALEPPPKHLSDCVSRVVISKGTSEDFAKNLLSHLNLSQPIVVAR